MAVLSTYWRVQIVKYWLAVGGKFWVNTYEVTSGVETSIDEVPSAIVDALVEYEREMHSTSVLFDRAVISSTEADSNPYDPTGVRSQSYGLFGLRAAEGQVDLNAVYRVRRDVEFGRSGKLSYRGVLTEADVDAGGQGFWQLAAGGVLTPAGSVWGDAIDHLTGLFTGTFPSYSEWRLCMVTNPGDTVNPLNVPRSVLGFTPVGAGFNKFNHRYFDRS